MDTTEIRNTTLSQWPYWAAAIPLIDVVILMGICFAGQLDSSLEWLLGNGHHRVHSVCRLPYMQHSDFNMVRKVTAVAATLHDWRV